MRRIILYVKAIPLQINDKPWWKKSQNLVIVVLPLSVGVAVAAIVAGLFSQSDGTHKSGMTHAKRETLPQLIGHPLARNNRLRSPLEMPVMIDLNTRRLSLMIERHWLLTLPGKTTKMTGQGMHTEDKCVSWKQKVGQWLETGKVNGDRFGHHMALSSDGKILAIGALRYWLHDDRPGFAQICCLEGDGTNLTWKRLGETIDWGSTW